MRARICDAVFDDIVREEGVFFVAVEGKEKHLHPGEPRPLDERTHAVVHFAEVFRDDARFIDAFEEFVFGAVLPISVDGGLLPRVHFVVAVEAAEVVDAHDIVRFERAVEARAPPAVVLFSMRCPIEHGIAPQLPRLREVIGGNARHLFGL